MCRSGDVTNRTCEGEWYHPIHGTPNVAAMIHRHDNVTNITRAVERYHLPICHPDRNAMEWRDLPKQQAFPYAGNFCNLGRFLHSADAAVGMTDVFALVGTNSNVQRIWRQIAAATPASNNGIPYVAAMIHRHDNVTNITRAVEWYHPPDMSSRPK